MNVRKGKKIFWYTSFSFLVTSQGALSALGPLFFKASDSLWHSVSAAPPAESSKFVTILNRGMILEKTVIIWTGCSFILLKSIKHFWILVRRRAVVVATAQLHSTKSELYNQGLAQVQILLAVCRRFPMVGKSGLRWK